MRVCEMKSRLERHDRRPRLPSIGAEEGEGRPH